MKKSAKGLLVLVLPLVQCGKGMTGCTTHIRHLVGRAFTCVTSLFELNPSAFLLSSKEIRRSAHLTQLVPLFGPPSRLTRSEEEISQNLLFPEQAVDAQMRRNVVDDTYAPFPWRGEEPS